MMKYISVLETLKRQRIQRFVNGSVFICFAVFYIAHLKELNNASASRFPIKMRIILVTALLYLGQTILNKILLWRILMIEYLMLILWILYSYTFCFFDELDWNLKYKGLAFVSCYFLIKGTLACLAFFFTLLLKPINK
jgi:hypothetical protein